MKHTILIVDDEPAQRRLLQHVVGEKLHYTIVTASSGQEAIEYILSGQQPADLMLLDLCMPKVNGIDVIRAVRPSKPQLPIIALTLQGDLEKGVEAVKAGANDFLAKPVPMERLNISIKNALQLHQLNHEVVRLRRNATGQVFFPDLIGNSPALKDCIMLGQQAASSHVPLLLRGENGVGKELFARAVHGSGDRSGKPFVSVNCSSIPEMLTESILFGHEKGSFPGAIYRTMGRFREAEGGTLFLDEVADLRPDMQVKLLHVIQHGVIQPLGAKDTARVNVRVICATSRDLLQLTQAGQFHPDLYFHLSPLSVTLPPLSQRKGDIPLLAKHLCARFAAVENKPIKGISPEAMEFLICHPWPGNVRQLENAIFRAIALCNGTELRLSDFQHSQMERLPRYAGNGAGMTPNGTWLNGFGGAPAMSNMLSPLDEQGNVRRMIDLEAELIHFALRHYHGHMSEVARRLGIGRSTLYRKISDLGISHAGNA